jgi:2-polyprenyl-6-methoxyphenol hydroxylase-like FAD-dependent oxidoreductase
VDDRSRASKAERALAEPARRVPVAYDADVAVVGAGPGGFAAALQAARMGCRVVVVERFDMPGGVHTSGLQGHASAGVGGIHSELMERFAAHGHIYTITERRCPTGPATRSRIMSGGTRRARDSCARASTRKAPAASWPQC